MVTEYGMSDLGPVQLEHQSEGVFLGRDYNKSRNFSDIVAHEIDEEIRKIVGECYQKATEILKENKDLVKLIAEALMERETLTKEQIEYLVEHKELPKETELEDMTLEELKELAKEKDIKGYSKLNKEELIDLLRVNDVKPELEPSNTKEE